MIDAFYLLCFIKRFIEVFCFYNKVINIMSIFLIFHNRNSLKWGTCHMLIQGTVCVQVTISNILVSIFLAKN